VVQHILAEEEPEEIMSVLREALRERGIDSTRSSAHEKRTRKLMREYRASPEAFKREHAAQFLFKEALEEQASKDWQISSMEGKQAVLHYLLEAKSPAKMSVETQTEPPPTAEQYF